MTRGEMRALAMGGLVVLGVSTACGQEEVPACPRTELPVGPYEGPPVEATAVDCWGGNGGLLCGAPTLASTYRECGMSTVMIVLRDSVERYEWVQIFLADDRGRAAGWAINGCDESPCSENARTATAGWVELQELADDVARGVFELEFAEGGGYRGTFDTTYVPPDE